MQNTNQNNNTKENQNKPIKNLQILDINTLNISQFLLAFSMPLSYEAKLLAYMVRHSIDGYYHSQRDSRKTMLKRMGMTNYQYDTAFKALLKRKVIRKGRSGNGGLFHYYKINPQFLEIISLREDFMLHLDITIKKK